jgi:MOSC domain-containing protein YiiM
MPTAMSRRNHGGPTAAVCLYAVEALARVAADGHEAFPGAYGENLTVEGHRLGPARRGRPADDR